jgi:hypothetical protein
VCRRRRRRGRRRGRRRSGRRCRRSGRRCRRSRRGCGRRAWRGRRRRPTWRCRSSWRRRGHRPRPAPAHARGSRTTRDQLRGAPGRSRPADANRLAGSGLRLGLLRYDDASLERRPPTRVDREWHLRFLEHRRQGAAVRVRCARLGRARPQPRRPGKRERDGSDICSERQPGPHAGLTDSAQIGAAWLVVERPSPGRGFLALSRPQGALGAVERAARARHEHLEATTVELPPAELTARESSRRGGRHSATACTRSATTTAFLPAAFAR